mgnify:CR=1 FL=1
MVLPVIAATTASPISRVLTFWVPSLQMSTVRNLLMAWVLTLPCAIVLSGTLYVIFSKIF